MGAADDIKVGLKKSLANFTKQRKAEEKHSSAGRWRTSRMMEVRGMFLTEAANEVMVECYMKVSDNGELPALARQIFYAARPLIEEQTDKPVSYSYFSQKLLPDYLDAHAAECADWDVVYDDRGHFTEPHTKRVVGLGTLNVRAYLNRVGDLELEEADFDAASVRTHGPHGCFGALLYVEKEGFMPLFKKVKLADRYDIGVMSSKGMSVVAARQLAEGICAEYDIPLLILHDFDRSGIIIKDTLENNTRRYTYKNPPRVIDFGPSYGDIKGLQPEPCTPNISDERLEQAGVKQDAIDFLRNRRIELNAMTSRQIVDFVEGELKQHRIGKVIPDAETLTKAYEMFATSDRLAEAFEEMKERLDEGESEAPVEVPKDLDAQIKKLFKKHPHITWHRAVRLIVDPDAPEDDDEEEEDEDDEGSSDE